MLDLVENLDVRFSRDAAPRVLGSEMKTKLMTSGFSILSFM